MKARQTHGIAMLVSLMLAGTATAVTVTPTYNLTFNPTAKQIATLSTPAQIATLSPKVIRTFSVYQTASFSSAQIAALNSDQLASFNQALQRINTNCSAAYSSFITSVNTPVNTTAFSYFMHLSENKNILSAWKDLGSSLARFSCPASSTTTTAQTPSMPKVAGVTSLSGPGPSVTEIEKLTDIQIETLVPDTMSAFSAPQAAAFTDEQISYFSDAQMQAYNTALTRIHKNCVNSVTTVSKALTNALKTTSFIDFTTLSNTSTVNAAQAFQNSLNGFYCPAATYTVSEAY
ncbi:MAG: hypothetical protein EB015_22490 [Methylocystaceae bacterium]|nr:hypothetical protein [Methylocystaceae bacterium]